MRRRSYGVAAGLLATLTPAQLGSMGAAAAPMLRQVVTDTDSPAAQVALAVAI